MSFAATAVPLHIALWTVPNVPSPNTSPNLILLKVPENHNAMHHFVNVHPPSSSSDDNW